MALPKRVHFSDSPLVISYTPPATPRSTLRTPSPTWSDDSDSDSAPSTPPSTSTFPQRSLPSLSPGSTLSSFSKASGSNSSSSPSYDSPLELKEVNPNPILYDPRTQASLLAWDVATLPTQHASIPSRARSVSRKSFIKAKMVGNSNTATKLSPADLSAPATRPSMNSLEIHIPQLPQYWKPIQLRRSGNKGSSPSSSPITVGEVLNAVHHHLQHSISQKEFDMLPEKIQKDIARGYWRRHDAVLVAAEGREDAEEVRAVKKAGIKRIDALARGCTRFVALVPVPVSSGVSKGDVWQVILAAPSQ